MPIKRLDAWAISLAAKMPCGDFNHRASISVLPTSRPQSRSMRSDFGFHIGDVLRAIGFGQADAACTGTHGGI